VHEITLPTCHGSPSAASKIEIDTSRKNPAAASQPATRCRAPFHRDHEDQVPRDFSPQGQPLKVEGLSEGMDAVPASERRCRWASSILRPFWLEYLADDMLEEQMRASSGHSRRGQGSRGGHLDPRVADQMPPFNIMTIGRGEYELLVSRSFAAALREDPREVHAETQPCEKPDLSRWPRPRGCWIACTFLMDIAGSNGSPMSISPAATCSRCGNAADDIQLSVEADPNAPPNEVQRESATSRRT